VGKQLPLGSWPSALGCLCCKAGRAAHDVSEPVSFSSPAWLLQGELDELEREEFFRLKKVQSNKKKHQLAAEALEKARLAALAAEKEQEEQDKPGPSPILAAIKKVANDFY
jgi:hypothetical protein